MTQQFGDYVNEADWDEDDQDDEEWDETLEERPREMEATFGLRGFLVVPGEYADDEAPEDDGIPFHLMAVQMTAHWRRCPACGRVETIYAGGEFWRDDCDQCNPIPF